ncbi:hypothetical protein GCM10010166_55530 [Couchioplanes caeruleus subsp. azureus]|nr:hypothetical protein GCM10010166_55530 [Couchioplanes caeruleus subsp. azureus]
MVIATIFLSVIGMSAGFVLGTRHEAVPVAERSDAPGTPDTQVSTDKRTECPEQMQETAERRGITGTLHQVLRVRTTDLASDTGTETTVWICETPDGALVYQANRGDEESEWIEGKTALFLTRVTSEGDTYVATADDGNKFFVNMSELRIKTKKGEERHDVEVE